MPVGRKYTPDLLPEKKVPRPLAEKNLYKLGGYQCWDCGFTSKKKGFSGRQALRAHLKKHKRERRAWQRPLLLQMAVVLVLMGAAIAGWLGVKLPFVLPFDTPVLTAPADITRWAVLGCTTGMIVISAVVLFSPAEYGGKTLATLSRLLVLVGNLAVLWGAAVAWELVSPWLSWPFQVPLWGLVALTPILAAKAGSVKLLVKRRGVRSSSYTSLMKPKNEKTRRKIRTWWSKWEQRMVESGKASYKCSNCGEQFKAGTRPGTGRCTGCGAKVRIGPPVSGLSSPKPVSQYPLYDHRG